MSEDDFEDLEEYQLVAAESALGLLDEGERDAFVAGAGDMPEWQAEAEHWAEVFARLAADLTPVPPPAELRAALIGRLFPEERKSLSQRLGLIPALIGGLAAALAVLVAAQFGLFGGGGPEPDAQIESPGGEVSIAAEISDGELVTALGEGAAPAGQVLQLWLILPDGNRQSLGVLPETGALRLTLPGDGTWPEGASLGLTASPDGALPDPAAPLIAMGTPLLP